MTQQSHATTPFLDRGIEVLLEGVARPGQDHAPLDAEQWADASGRPRACVTSVLIRVHEPRTPERRTDLGAVVLAIWDAVRSLAPAATVDVSEASRPDNGWQLGFVDSDQQPAVAADGRLTVDLARRVAQVDGHRTELTNREFELLSFLVHRKGLAISRTELMQQVWGTNYAGGMRTIDVHIRRLRVKLGSVGAHIVTVRGYGYSLS